MDQVDDFTISEADVAKVYAFGLTLCHRKFLNFMELCYHSFLMHGN